jgi:hypothetical protein
MLAPEPLHSATQFYLMERVNVNMGDEILNKCSPTVPCDEVGKKGEFMCDLEIQWRHNQPQIAEQKSTS